MGDAYDALVIGGVRRLRDRVPPGQGRGPRATGREAGLPRDKVCGDGLTQGPCGRSTRWGSGPSQSWSRSAGLKVHGGGHVIELPWPELEDYPSFGLARPRTDLDQLLARTAPRPGPTCGRPPTCSADGRARPGQGAVIRREGEDPVDVRAEVVVAADGASSRFAQALGLVRDDHRPIGVAIRQYYCSARDTDPWIDSYLELWRGDHLLPGYGWVFPLADGTVNVGCGLLNTSEGFRNTNYRDLLKEWLPTVAAEWGFDPAEPVAKPRSAPCP